MVITAKGWVIIKKCPFPADPSDADSGMEMMMVVGDGTAVRTQAVRHDG